MDGATWVEVTKLEVPSAETLADETNVKTLQCLGFKLDKHYQQECQAALEARVWPIWSHNP